MATSRRLAPGGGKWQTVRYALDSWSRTVRLCLIVLAMQAPVTVLIWLIKH